MVVWNQVPLMSTTLTMKKTRTTQRREESLSPDQIIEAAIALLDSRGEGGLTFRALSEQLVTGPGAIYWHISDKSELLTLACDAVVSRTVNASLAETTPAGTIRVLALNMFDAMDAHPWLGSALARASVRLPVLRILERLGQEVRALKASEDQEWAAACALLNYILGVGAQNAENAQLARARGIDRLSFLNAVSDAWSRLDPDEYPFARSMAPYLHAHDDRKDFLMGVELILRGLKSVT